jgi:serine O-acetyltransferase
MWTHIKADVYRWNGSYSKKLLLLSFVKYRGFRFILILRLAKYFRKTPLLNILFLLLYKFFKIIYTSDINFKSEIGPGFRIHHVFGTTWGKDVKIGANVTVVHNVTIAGKNGKWPIIGDSVYLGSGCCILGGINIGNHVIVGANCVVTKNMPNHAIVVGNPAKIIGYNVVNELIVNPKV